MKRGPGHRLLKSTKVFWEAYMADSISAVHTVVETLNYLGARPGIPNVILSNDLRLY